MRERGSGKQPIEASKMFIDFDQQQDEAGKGTPTSSVHMSRDRR
jgi:hypothetical protein